MSFTRAFLPIALMVLIALIAVFVSLGMTDRAIRKSNHKASYHSISLHLKNMQDFQEIMILDHTRLRNSYSDLTIKNDLNRFHKNIGGAYLPSMRIHGMAFINNDGRLVAQETRDNNPAFAITQKTIDQNLPAIKTRALSRKNPVTQITSFFMEFDEMPGLISFSPITLPDPDTDIIRDKRDYLAFWTILTPESLIQISKTHRIKDLSATDKQSPTHYPLKDGKGNIIASLKWSLEKAETSTLNLPRYMNFAMFSLMLIAGYISFLRLSELITELNRAKSKAEQGSRIKSDFLATMSHELRTPLNSIIGFSDILKRDNEANFSEKQNEYVDHIQTSSNHLLNIINEILDMSKIEAGKFELFEVEMDIQRVLDQSIAYVKKDMEDKKIRLNKKIAGHLNEFMGDEKVMKQLFLNLLSNAIKFTPEKGQITINCAIAEKGDLVIYVEDTGVGISPERLAIITKPYMQDQDHKTRPHQGTGLGLAISKAFTELHQGTLEIDSELNRGTRVTLTFPAARLLPESV